MTNLKNGKIYIGKTLSSVKKRWGEHCRDSRKERCELRPLYAAIRKYGEDMFSVETIEECPASALSEREIYWIQYYGSFKNGYNATAGGDGSQYIDYSLVIATYNRLKNQRQTAKMLNIDKGTVRKILRINNIDILSSGQIEKDALGQCVDMFSLSGEYERSFVSARDAARGVIRDCAERNVRGAATHILDVCKGKRKSAYGHSWQYSDMKIAT